jgi:hypothetical protein
VVVAVGMGMVAESGSGVDLAIVGLRCLGYVLMRWVL